MGHGPGHLGARGGGRSGRDPGRALDELVAAEAQLSAAGMVGYLAIARLRRGLVEGGAIGSARAAAARDFLRDLGALDPDAVAMHLMPWLM
ncbi:MAG: hypothetical protein KIT31_38800 [Deltaproteobacteria bacterium]|nr:hypothetical protein [Deltaproteobacteria bacterium]